MNRAPTRWLAALLSGVFILSFTGPAEAKCKVVTRGFKSYLKCTGSIAKSAGKLTKAAQKKLGRPIAKATKAVGKGVIHLGGEFQDIGRDLNRAAIDAGHDINRAAIDVGKGLERVGQDIGNLLKWAGDFSLSCKIPGQAPKDLDPAYRACGARFSSYRQAHTVCMSAGGASVIAAGLANSATTFGVSVAVAKVAFELCEDTCRKQKALESCMKKVEAGATIVSEKADAAAAANADIERRLPDYRCATDALNQELMWRLMSPIKQCEASPDCHPTDEAFIKRFESDAAEIKKNIDERRARIDRAFEQKISIEGLDYGRHVMSTSVVSIALTSNVVDRVPVENVCNTSASQVSFWTHVRGLSGRSIEHRWVHGDAEQDEAPLFMSKTFSVGSDSWRTWSTKELPADHPGVWTVYLVGPDDEILAKHRFLSLQPG